MLGAQFIHHTFGYRGDLFVFGKTNLRMIPLTFLLERLMEIISLAECVAWRLPRFTDLRMWRCGRRRGPLTCRARISERLPVKSTCAKLNVVLLTNLDGMGMERQYAA